MFKIYQNYSDLYDELVNHEDYNNNLYKFLNDNIQWENKVVGEFGIGTGRVTMTDVATGMPDLMHKNYVTPLLTYFDLYVSSLSCGYKKPNPKGLRDISEHFGIAPENMVMIGDTSRDVNAAKNIGCHSILINRSGKPPQDFGQEYTVTSAM